MNAEVQSASTMDIVRSPCVCKILLSSTDVDNVLVEIKSYRGWTGRPVQRIHFISISYANCTHTHIVLHHNKCAATSHGKATLLNYPRERPLTLAHGSTSLFYSFVIICSEVQTNGPTDQNVEYFFSYGTNQLSLRVATWKSFSFH